MKIINCIRTSDGGGGLLDFGQGRTDGGGGSENANFHRTSFVNGPLSIYLHHGILITMRKEIMYCHL